MPARQIAEPKISDSNAEQSFDAVSDGLKHAANLPIYSLPQDNAKRVGERERSRGIFARWPSRTIPRSSFGASDGSHGRSSVISYSLSTLKRGWVSRCANSPSLVRSSKPSVCASRRPMLKSRENFLGRRSKTVLRAWIFSGRNKSAGFMQHDG